MKLSLVFILAIVAVAGMLGTVRADAVVKAADAGTIFLCLDSMHLKDGLLIIRRSNQQGIASLKIQIGKAAPTECPAGATFSVPKRTPCFLFNDELMLKILPASSPLRRVRNSWLVEEQNQRGDVQVCLLQPFLHHEGTPDPTWHELEMGPLKIYQDSSLHDIERECGVESTGQPITKEEAK